MTGAPFLLADLSADCEAHGIRLALAGEGGLTIDAPQGALTPDLLDRLKAHKADLLAMLRTDAAAPPVAPESTFDTPDGLGIAPAERPAESNLEHSPHAAKPCDKPKAVCRCGGTTWRDVPIHGGQSVRRDCAACGRFLDFPVWHGKAAGHNGQHPV